ncbi:unnamed protein product [Orchesella dallaii]|uniref:BPTI/Kunitz inhibitor domain-containing protein n=1 Tax=Orchesella dallaii TaxID=48710 RepID=A0ABP1QSZ2_9HEXA
MKILKYLALVTLILSVTNIDKVSGGGGFLDFLFGKSKSNGHGSSNSKTGSGSGDDVCVLPAEAGPCRGAFGMWFWDAKRGLCDYFIYGGCSGNGNRFESYQACQTKCSRPIKGTNYVLW